MHHHVTSTRRPPAAVHAVSGVDRRGAGARAGRQRGWSGIAVAESQLAKRYELEGQCSGRNAVETGTLMLANNAIFMLQQIARTAVRYHQQLADAEQQQHQCDLEVLFGVQVTWRCY